MEAAHSPREKWTPPLLATKTRSAGVVASAANDRQLSLSSRLIRFRATALPSLFPTQNPTRVLPATPVIQ